MTARKVGLVLGLASLILASLPALEAKEGLVKITVQDSTGYFSLYRLVDVAKERYEALFFDQDVKTSGLVLSFEGRQYRLGESADFRQATSRTDKGLQIVWSSSFARVTARLEFAKSKGAAISDGIKLAIGVDNVSQKEARIGLRLLIDTYLGEKSGIHFRTATKDKIGSETVYESPNIEAWVASPGDQSVFMLQFVGEGLDKPDRVHLANWKRLSDATWQLDASTARNFTLLPYSVNDSSVAIYWNPKPVASGGTTSVTMAMGNFNADGYPPASKETNAADALFAKTVLNQGSQGDSKSQMSADLLSVRDLLSRIDLVISSGSAPNADEVQSWKKILDLLEERKKGY